MSSTDNEAFFTQTHPTRLFLTAAIPGAVSMLASAMYNVCEGLFVGQLVGETAFAAVNLAMPLVIINYALADLVGVGSSVPISIALGKGEGDRANNIFSCACLLTLVVGVITGAGLFLGAPAIFAAMGARGDLANTATWFLQVNAAFSPITTIFFAVDNYLRICGRIKRSTSVNLLMGFLGVGLLILFLGVFKWDVRGAALAFSLSTTIAVLIAFLPFFRGQLQLRFVRPRYSWALVRRIVGDGLPTFLNNVAGQATSIILNFFLLSMGGADAVSIFGMVMYMDAIALPLIYGILDALQPAVGFNWGRRDLHRVKQIEVRCFVAVAVISAVLVLVANLVPEQITHLFLTEAKGDLLKTAVFALRLFSLGYTVRWFGMAAQCMLVALSQPRLASVISLASSFILPVALAWLLMPLELTGMWLNFPVASWLSSLLAAAMLLFFRRELRGGRIEVGR